MTTSRWRSRSREIIYAVLLKHEAQALLLDEPIDEKALFKEVSSAYPFGARAHHPYKQWLKEVALARQYVELGRAMNGYPWWASQNERQCAGPEVVEGQMSLLEVTT